MRPWLAGAAVACCAIFTTPAAHAYDELLNPAQAFSVLDVTRAGDTVLVDWVIAPDYAVFRKRVQVKAADGLSVGQTYLPPGYMVRDELGEVSEEYLEGFQMQVPVTGNAGSLVVTLQGCHQGEPKVCFLPYTVRVPVSAG